MALYRAYMDPVKFNAVVTAARAFGELWLFDAVDTIGDRRVVTRNEAARIAGVRPDTIRKWVQRGHIEVLPSGGYDYEALLSFIETRDTSEK